MRGGDNANPQAPHDNDLISKIINFPVYLEKFSSERSPHSLVHFTKELAANYHSFYEQNSVITDNQEESNARLLITKATSIVLKNSFKIIVSFTRTKKYIFLNLKRMKGSSHEIAVG